MEYCRLQIRLYAENDRGTSGKYKEAPAVTHTVPGQCFDCRNRHFVFGIQRGYYTEVLTKDYIQNLCQSAPMHDIGKIAVADVFDAVSEKRCYRDALSLEQCFSIIREGSGRDFDPRIAEVFLDSKEKVEKIHNEIITKR